MKKGGQFFLLAAVVISVVVIGLGLTYNVATVNPEPEGFQDIGVEVKKETGAVIDYELRSWKGGELGTGELGDFVDDLAENVRDRNPDANFIFIYGNKDDLTLANYGIYTILVECEKDPNCKGDLFGRATKIKSTICDGSICSDFDHGVYNGERGVWEKRWCNDGCGDFFKKEDDSLKITVRKNDFNFPITENRQVIFIIQKDAGEETFVSVR